MTNKKDHLPVPNFYKSPKYTHTKVVSVDLNLLRKNRVLATSRNENIYEYYRFLRTQILRKMQANNWNTILVTSVAPNEGKTLNAINLAITFAKEITKTVLLVDTDLRKPAISALLGLNIDKGLSNYLTDDQMPLSNILINPGIEKLVILPAGQPVSNATELLDSPRMHALVQEVKNRYPDRYIFFDSPPILSYADTLVLSSYVDAILLVVKAYETSQKQLKRALDMLKDRNVLGIAINMIPLKEKDILHYLD